MENELKIKVSSDGGTTISMLEARIKELRAEFKATKIGTTDFSIAGQELKKTLEQKTQAMKAAQTENAKMMESYFKLGENLRRNTNPAFISFNQIVQDAPFGIRGVGNNIQFLTQQFTQLRTAGMTTGDILKGMMGNILTPMGGLMFAVSAGTSLLTIAMDSLGTATEKTKEKAFDLNAELERQRDMQRDIRTAQYEAGSVSGSQRIKELMIELKALQLQRAAMFDIMQMRNGNMPAAFNASNFDTTPRAPGTTSAVASSTGVSVNANIEKMVTAKNKQLDLDSQILDLEKEMLGVQKDSYDENFRLLKLRVAERDFIAQTFETSTGTRAFKEVSWQKLPGSRKFGQIDPMKDNLEGVRVRATNEIRTLDETMADIFEEDVKKMADAYNSFLFDPIKAGTRQLAGEIHQSLFGAMDDLERKFGRVGASMIGALEGVISKLIEAVMWSAVMSFVPGAQPFGAILSTTLGFAGGGSNRTMLSNLSTPKGPGESVVVVQVEGKLGNDAIYLAGKNFIGRQKVAVL